MNTDFGRPRETPEQYRNRTSRNKLVHEFKLRPLEIQLLKDRVNRQKGRGYVAGEHDAYLLHLDDIYKRKEEERKKKYEDWLKDTPEGRIQANIDAIKKREMKEFYERGAMGREDERMQKIHEKLRYNERQEKMIQENKRFRQNREIMGEEDERSRVLREHSKETERLMLLQREREMAMLLPTIEEPNIIDRSDQIKMNVVKGGTYQPEINLYGATGVGFHINIGERHPRAKLTDVKAQEIRTRYWAIPEDVRPSVNAFANQIKNEYEIAVTTLQSVLRRKTWTGALFPLVAGEPVETLNELTVTEAKILTKAIKEGLSTLVNKTGKARFTDEQIAEQREEVARILREKDTEKGRKKAEKDEQKRLKKEADDLKKAEEKVRKKLEREAKKEEKSK